MMLCIQCAMKAMLDGKEAPTFPDETPEQHMAKHHPDPVAAKLERTELEKRLADKIGRKP